MKSDTVKTSYEETVEESSEGDGKLDDPHLAITVPIKPAETKEQRKKAKEQSRRQQAPCVQRAGTIVSEGLELLFYKLGFGIAKRPWTVILCTFLVSALCGLGMIRFEVKDSSEPIWVSDDSVVLKNQRWVEDQFPLKFRYNLLIITADNILTPEVLREMLRIDTLVKDMKEYNNTESEEYNFNWTSICIRIGENCWSNNLLELWSFNKTQIEMIEDTSEIVSKINQIKNSPVYHNEYKFKDWLGDISYNDDGKIIGAKAAKMLYVVRATSSDEFNTHIQAPDLLWETRFIKLGKDLNMAKSGGIKEVAVSAVRRDESDNSFDADVMLLMAGVCVIVAYVAIILGKFNEVEHKVYLALVGVFGIGLASLVSYGLASACGMFYGPIHPILPFLLLGLGVDDMFVIIEAWNNLTTLERKKDLASRVAIAMKHAGVSITVTSITDFVAFAIGASTDLPALKSFCVYAALGILSLFIIQSTFFVAWMTIDQRRQDASRDACCIWIKYSNFEPNKCSKRQFLPWFLRRFLAPLLVSVPIKVLVCTMVICMLGISSYGTSLLKTESDLSWFLPTDSYLTNFINVQEEYFDDGVVADVYIGSIDYYRNGDPLENMVGELQDSNYVIQDSFTNWHKRYKEWLNSDLGAGMAERDGIKLNNRSFPASEEDYYKALELYADTFGRQFAGALKWNDTTKYAPKILEASKVGFKVQNLESSEAEVDALEYFEKLTEKYLPGQSFIWSAQFRSWDTNRVIQSELYTNLGLAFVAVLIVTLFLVANLWVCILVCLCVIITLVNVCGFMHFWGLTIDTLTSILLILSIGLAIDYSAHIGHKFMTIGGSRNERAKFTVATIGPAIINGGFSTFLAFILLATSNSYVFTTFFKVFFLVVVFGLFNGLCLLPVLLSVMGPHPYLNATHIDLTSNMSITLKELSSYPGTATAPHTGTVIPQDHLSKQNIHTILEDANQSYSSRMQTVQHYIHSLPNSQVEVDPNNDYELAPDASNREEIEALLTKLEKDTMNGWADAVDSEEHTVEVHPIRDHHDIIDVCEQYLCDDETQPKPKHNGHAITRQQKLSNGKHETGACNGSSHTPIISEPTQVYPNGIISSHKLSTQQGPNSAIS